MSLIRINPRSYARLLTIFRDGKRNYSVVAKEEEFSETPQYPPILEISLKANEKRKEESFHEEIKNLNTVEEKLIKINMPRYYGWKSVILNENFIPYNSESMAQFITRTHIVKDQGLPKHYDRVMPSEKVDATLQQVKKQIEDVVLFEHTSRRREEELKSYAFLKNPRLLSDVIGDAIVRQINRILLSTLSSESAHLLEAQVDYDPRIEAFWFAGGMQPPKEVKRAKESSLWQKKYADEFVDRRLNYKGNPILQLRHDLPLPEIVSLSESENPAFTIPEFRYDPRVLGYTVKYLHGTSIPGFWPGDQSEFGILSYHRRGHIDSRRPTFNDEADALNVQAIYASYSWLLSQACYQGFSTFTDVTYPLLTQTVITNGQSWNFYVYQLNTTLVHSEHADDNPRRNLCWTTGSMKLFEKIEDGKLVGFNDDVLKELIKFYGNAPQKRDGINMKPYLGTTEQKVADISDPEKRTWLENCYKHLVCNRPRHLRREEVDHWEMIYKIKFNTRFMDKKRKNWEYGIKTMTRKLDDHAPVYIPKSLRPGGPKSKNKFRKTYYP